MWKLLADLANVYCSAASWAWAARDSAQAQRLVEQAICCLRQRKGQAKRASSAQATVECN
jgi:hypothetical protein